MATIKAPKKLIEVALPLDDINEHAAAEKNNPFLKAHPRNLHLWWARRPLATARAVLFAQLVNDPGYERHLGRGLNKQQATLERERLFEIVRKLIDWDNIANQRVLEEARKEIDKSWREVCRLNRDHPQAASLFNPERMPSFHDPFAGGGAIPLEAQRLGLSARATDLNPVAVLINKAMIEVPPRFSGQQPIGPTRRDAKQRQLHDDWTGNKGLAEDIRRYGAALCSEARKRIGHLYPEVLITSERVKHRPDLLAYAGKKLTITAWIWARTVKSPNPAFSHVDVPLTTSFVLSNKAGRQVWIEPIVRGDSYSFSIRLGDPPEGAENGTKLARGSNFQCLLSGSPIDPSYLKEQGKRGNIGTKLMALVAEGVRERVYLEPTDDLERLAQDVEVSWRPETRMPNDPRAFTPIIYGHETYGSLFTSRQIKALETFSDIAIELREQIKRDAVASGVVDDGKSLEAGGCQATAYADAIAMYLGMAISQYSRFFVSFAIWNATNQNIAHGFGRQAIPVTWDFPEANPLAGNLTIETAVSWVATPLAEALCSGNPGEATQSDARVVAYAGDGVVVSTDPPYYDNVPYADLSDFFYALLRRSLRPILPSLFATLSTPKADELVAAPYRQGSKAAAEAFFLEGMTAAMRNIASNSHPAFPVTIYYAFKQSETGEGGTVSTGWETFLAAVIKAGFSITGTWPVRTERAERMRGKASNALASSIVLVCRRHLEEAPTISRREFIRELNAVLPDALDEMTRGGVNSPVTPVDLSQAIIGPGMGIFSSYSAVLEADGSPMSVHAALTLINRFLSEDDFDADTQFCLGWFDEQGWEVGEFGQANVLAQAKGTNVDRVRDAGVISASAGRVRLLRPAEYQAGWSPEKDNRTPIWEALHYLVRALRDEGESEAGKLLAFMPQRAEPIRNLAYRLYTLCERKGWADDARAYNELVTAWSAIEQASGEAGVIGSQAQLDI